MKSIAIYLRVSTDRQTTDSQAVELRDYCQRRGWTGVQEYADVCSGAKSSREGLDRLMTDARRGRLDAIVCYKLDRLGRSLPHLAQLIGELTVHRVALIVPAQGIDTSAANPASQLQLNILMAVADFEREIIRERVNSGLRAAKARGVKLGRPMMVAQHLPKVRELVESGASIRAIARETGLSLPSAHKLARMARASAAERSAEGGQ